MKKGINTLSFPGGKRIEDCMRIAKKAGFDGIELGITEKGELTLDSGEEALRSILNLFYMKGLFILHPVTEMFIASKTGRSNGGRNWVLLYIPLP